MHLLFSSIFFTSVVTPQWTSFLFCSSSTLYHIFCFSFCLSFYPLMYLLCPSIFLTSVVTPQWTSLFRLFPFPHSIMFFHFPPTSRLIHYCIFSFLLFSSPPLLPLNGLLFVSVLSFSSFYYIVSFFPLLIFLSTNASSLTFCFPHFRYSSSVYQFFQFFFVHRTSIFSSTL